MAVREATMAMPIGSPRLHVGAWRDLELVLREKKENMVLRFVILEPDTASDDEAVLTET